VKNVNQAPTWALSISIGRSVTEPYVTIILIKPVQLLMLFSAHITMHRNTPKI